MTKRILPIFLLLMIVPLLGFFIYDDELLELEWKTYTKKSILKDKLAIVNFSSHFCHACKLNEKLIYSTNRFKKIILDNDISVFYADYLIQENAIILDELGYDTIPILVLFNPNGDIVILDGLLDIDNTIKEILKATKSDIKKN